MFGSVKSDQSLRHQALWFLAGAALLWSLGGLFIKSVAWNPIAIAGMRSAIAAFVMFLYKRKFEFNWSKAQIAGAIAYTSTVILFVSANKLTTAANAILLQYSAPIYVAMMGQWFLNERTTKLDWLTIGVVCGGMLLFFLDNLSAGNLWGNVLAILSGVAFASLTVLSRKQKDGSPLESLFLGNLLTACIGLPFMLQSMPDGKSWLVLILLGTVQLGLSYILYSIAIKQVTALEGILVPIIEPILNPLWVWLLLGEKPGQWALVGGTIVLVAVTARCILVALHERKNIEAAV